MVTTIYTGAESVYSVSADNAIRRNTRRVTILSVLSGPGSIPIGVTVVVPSRSVRTLLPSEEARYSVN